MKIHTVTNGHSAAYLIEHEGRAMLIDTAVPGTAPAILAALGETELPLGLIVLTHFHYDHSGSAAEVREATGAQIAVHHLDAAALRGGDSIGEAVPTGLIPRLMLRSIRHNRGAGLVPDHELGDEQDLDALGGFGRSFSTLGHTPGSVSLALPDGSVMAGDALAGGFISRHRAHGPMFVTDAAAARRSIALIAATATNNNVYPAHGASLNPRSLAALAA